MNGPLSLQELERESGKSCLFTRLLRMIVDYVESIIILLLRSDLSRLALKRGWACTSNYALLFWSGSSGALVLYSPLGDAE